MARIELRLFPGAEVRPGYFLVSWLGSGGAGEVWQAVAPDDTPCGMKFIDLDHGAASREARALDFMKSLRHPNLIMIQDVFSIENYLVVAMELCQGTLKDRLDVWKGQGGAGIPGQELIGYMGQAAQGIDFLNAPQHLVGGAQGVRIVHQDIKPQNLLLFRETVKVADFGLARTLERSLTTKTTGGMTPVYAPPEFFHGETAEQSDQYSLAVTYCQLRGGRTPFTGTPYQLMAGHTNGSPDLSMLPESERSVVAIALSKNRHDRWTNCTAFVENLRNCLSSDELTAQPSSTTSETIEYRDSRGSSHSSGRRPSNA